MKFSLAKPVKIVMIGAGGTGGYAAPHIYRLLHTLQRPVRFIIADGDIVEEKNLKRQNFIDCDLGGNKARVMAERYASAFGMEIEYIPEFIEDEQMLYKLAQPHYTSNGYYNAVLQCEEISILIGAVDNNKSRKLCHEVFQKSRDLVYIDSGNGEYTGQVVCGIRRKNRSYYKPVGTLYPDILEDTDKFPSELSCAEAAISAPQSITANLIASLQHPGIRLYGCPQRDVFNENSQHEAGCYKAQGQENSSIEPDWKGEVHGEDLPVLRETL